MTFCIGHFWNTIKSMQLIPKVVWLLIGHSDKSLETRLSNINDIINIFSQKIIIRFFCDIYYIMNWEKYNNNQILHSTVVFLNMILSLLQQNVPEWKMLQKTFERTELSYLPSHIQFQIGRFKCHEFSSDNLTRQTSNLLHFHSTYWIIETIVGNNSILWFLWLSQCHSCKITSEYYLL